MAEYWLCFFFACLWTLTLFWSIKFAKKEHGQYPAILTWTYDCSRYNTQYITQSIRHGLGLRFPTRTSLVVDNSNWNVFHVSSCSSSSFVLGFNKTLTPLKIIGKKIQSVVQIKFINIMLPEVPRMMGKCCNGLTSIFCYKYSFHSQINEYDIFVVIKKIQRRK